MSLERQRHRMLEEHLAARGIDDARVLAAMSKVPRERLISATQREQAYDDRALPIEAGQTISQPYIVALMAQELRLAPGDRLLEIGTGSGYAAAVYAELVAEVFTLERYAQLAESARQKLAELGVRNVAVRCADGTLGWPEHAPYQAISVAAAGPVVPPALLEQLALGGRLVMPVGQVGDLEVQRLVRVIRRGRAEYETEDLGGVQFVPLVAGSVVE